MQYVVHISVAALPDEPQEAVEPSWHSTTYIYAQSRRQPPYFYSTPINLIRARTPSPSRRLTFFSRSPILQYGPPAKLVPMPHRLYAAHGGGSGQSVSRHAKITSSDEIVNGVHRTHPVRGSPLL